MLLDEIISSYCSGDDELFNELSEELSKFLHRKGTDMEIQPGDLSESACACWTLFEEHMDKIKDRIKNNRPYGSLVSMWDYVCSD
jgi:hypothetical protein